MSNPWTTDTPEGALISILSAQGCHSNITEDDIADNLSLKHIAALKDITALSEAIHTAELEVLNRNLYKDNSDLISISSMTQVQSTAEEVSQCLTAILDNRDGLITRLKSPHEEGRLVVEARYQKYAVSTFEQLGKVLSQLTIYISNVEQYNSCRLNEVNIEQSSKQIVELSNSLRSLYDNLSSELKNITSIRGIGSNPATFTI